MKSTAHLWSCRAASPQNIYSTMLQHVCVDCSLAGGPTCTDDQLPSALAQNESNVRQTLIFRQRFCTMSVKHRILTCVLVLTMDIVIFTNKRSQAKVSTVYLFYWQRVTIICNMNCLNIQLYTWLTTVSPRFTYQSLNQLREWVYVINVLYHCPVYKSCLSHSLQNGSPYWNPNTALLAFLSVSHYGPYPVSQPQSLFKKAGPISSFGSVSHKGTYPST